MIEFWVVWDLPPEVFTLADGRCVVGKPGDRLKIEEDESGRRIVAYEPKPLH